MDVAQPRRHRGCCRPRREAFGRGPRPRTSRATCRNRPTASKAARRTAMFPLAATPPVRSPDVAGAAGRTSAAPTSPSGGRHGAPTATTSGCAIDSTARRALHPAPISWSASTNARKSPRAAIRGCVSHRRHSVALGISMTLRAKRPCRARGRSSVDPLSATTISTSTPELAIREDALEASPQSFRVISHGDHE